MSGTLSDWENNMIDHRLRKVISITENEFSFMSGRSTAEAILSTTWANEKI